MHYTHNQDSYWLDPGRRAMKRTKSWIFAAILTEWTPTIFFYFLKDKRCLKTDRYKRKCLVLSYQHWKIVILRVKTASTPLALCLSFVSWSSALWFKWLPLSLNVDLGWYSGFPLNWPIPNIYFKTIFFNLNGGGGYMFQILQILWVLCTNTDFRALFYIPNVLHFASVFSFKVGDSLKFYINKYNQFQFLPFLNIAYHFKTLEMQTLPKPFVVLTWSFATFKSIQRSCQLWTKLNRI